MTFFDLSATMPLNTTFNTTETMTTTNDSAPFLASLIDQYPTGYLRMVNGCELLFTMPPLGNFKLEGSGYYEGRFCLTQRNRVIADDLSTAKVIHLLNRATATIGR